jgi:hypothetical protein
LGVRLAANLARHVDARLAAHMGHTLLMTVGAGHPQAEGQLVVLAEESSRRLV